MAAAIGLCVASCPGDLHNVVHTLAMRFGHTFCCQADAETLRKFAALARRVLVIVDDVKPKHEEQEEEMRQLKGLGIRVEHVSLSAYQTAFSPPKRRRAWTCLSCIRAPEVDNVSVEEPQAAIDGHDQGQGGPHGNGNNRGLGPRGWTHPNTGSDVTPLSYAGRGGDRDNVSVEEPQAAIDGHDQGQGGPHGNGNTQGLGPRGWTHPNTGRGYMKMLSNGSSARYWNVICEEGSKTGNVICRDVPTLSYGGRGYLKMLSNGSSAFYCNVVCEERSTGRSPKGESVLQTPEFLQGKMEEFKDPEYVPKYVDKVDLDQALTCMRKFRLAATEDPRQVDVRIGETGDLLSFDDLKEIDTSLDVLILEAVGRKAGQRKPHMYIRDATLMIQTPRILEL